MPSSGFNTFTGFFTLPVAVTAESITPVQLRHTKLDLRILVEQQGDYYQVSGKLWLHDQPFDLKGLSIQYEYFVAVHGALYLLDDLDVWRVVEFFSAAQ